MRKAAGVGERHNNGDLGNKGDGASPKTTDVIKTGGETLLRRRRATNQGGKGSSLGINLGIGSN